MAIISVITVVKDHQEGLQLTHSSLLRQFYPDWEMIIVVGRSSDRTLRTAKEIEGSDKRVLVIEQSGSGIYEAMNEGLAVASGEFIWFMNAGDKFATESAIDHALTLIFNSRAGVVIGGYQVENGIQGASYTYSSRELSALRFAFNRRGGCHQAMLFRTEVVKELGGFNPHYSLAGDFDLVIKVIRSTSAYRASEIYAAIEPGGRADQGIFLVHKQKHEIRRKLFGGPVVFFASVIWTALVWVKMFVRWFVRKIPNSGLDK